MDSSIKKRILIGGIIITGAALILLLYLPAFRPDTSGTTVSGTAMIGGPFALVDQAGVAVSEKVLLGHYNLIYFGFTFCPDICPMTLQVVADAINLLPGQKKLLIQPVFITLDPERDSVGVMSDYVRHFHPHMLGLTGTMKQVSAAAAAYRIFFKKRLLSDDGEYTIDHSGFLYLVNRRGRYIDHFGKDVTVDELTSRLRELL